MSRAAIQVSLREGKIISDEDLALLNTNRGIAAPGLQKIRQTHRLAARLMALGMKDGDVAVAVGLSPGRLSILKNDPAFTALIQTFQNHKDAHTIDIMEKVHEVGMIAIEELRDRILDAPDEISSSQLLDITTAALDRLGHGPQAKLSVTTVNITALKEAAHAARRDQISFRQNVPEAHLVIEGEAYETPTDGADL